MLIDANLSKRSIQKVSNPSKLKIFHFSSIGRSFCGIKLVMKTTPKRKRPKAPSIQTIDETNAWVLISKAADESRLTELQIRKSGITLRKFGNADYIRPLDLNTWINSDGEKETQP